MTKALQHLLSTIISISSEEQFSVKDKDVIKVSETVSVAASVYETIRNVLEYDDEHLLRRNAILRILKRRLGETDSKKLAEKLIKELIWAKYLQNARVPVEMIKTTTDIIEKYKPMFAGLHGQTREVHGTYIWLLDVLSSEIEYTLAPPSIDEALASYAYQELKQRIEWKSTLLNESERDLQLYVAIHRAVLKSNQATLRFRVLTLYYPKWRTASAGDALSKEIALNLKKVIDSVDAQIRHKAQDSVYRFVRREAILFHVIADVARDNPNAFSNAVQTGDMVTLDAAATSAAKDRYKFFRTRLRRTVIRSMFFLLFTKSILAILVEYPYELFVLRTTDYLPLAINILFPPTLLAIVGLSASLPQKKNTEKILEHLHAILGFGEDFTLIFKRKNGWSRGPLMFIFNVVYVVIFLAMVFLILSGLRLLSFNVMSTVFFVFFLSLVAYFGLRIRNTKREYTIVDSSGGFLGVLGDILFLPLVRAGRWVALRAPRVNIFLFFFDFIIEAPFKATIDIIESWLAFLKEKREEI